MEKELQQTSCQEIKNTVESNSAFSTNPQENILNGLTKDSKIISFKLSSSFPQENILSNEN
ncbi:MAG: hypothetical protein HUU50_05390 [Candidatus Brocadiae bacterium]|nr:hypothetical protein [Candidatus Brocadiia bacterium]